MLKLYETSVLGWGGLFLVDRNELITACLESL